MIITDFLRCHLGDASLLALSNYYEERFAVPALPQMDAVPDLAEFADGGLGVAAVDCGKLAGFLCFYPPWDNAFTTAARGTFSPVHAHGAVREGRELIYRRMYQAAAEKLVGAGIASHAVSLYAHDAEAIHALFTYGFGLRCVDAIMLMEPICGAKTCGLTLRELDAGEAPLVRGLRRALSAHLAASPCFMYSTPEQFESWLDRAERRDSRLFAAFDGDAAVAFVEITGHGENFACSHPSVRNICGAYCAPEHRGVGVYQNLLDFTINRLRSEGFTRLGVDFESFNPTANSFWHKYFTAYTNSVVRRIDDNIFGRKPS